MSAGIFSWILYAQASHGIPAVTGLTISGRTATSLSYDWTASYAGNPREFNDDHYELKLDTDVVNYNVDIFGEPSSYTWTGLGPNQLGVFNVRTCVQGGQCGLWVTDDLFTYTLANPPGNPTGFPSGSCGYSVDGNSITWSWTANGNPAGTQFYVSNTGNSGWTTGTSWAQSGSCGTTYTTTVKAKNGNNIDTTTISCSATTAACPKPDLIVSAPSISAGPYCAGSTYSLSSTVTNQGNSGTPPTISVSYDHAGSNRCSGSGNGLSAGASLNNYSCNYTPSSAGSQSIYAIVDKSKTISEINESNNQSPTNLSVNFLAKPGTPSGLAESGATQSSITWGWNAVSGASSYDVYLDGNYKTTVTTTSYQATGLNCGLSYTLAVTAVNACGSSSTSASDAASTSLCSWFTGTFGACSVPANQCSGTQTRVVECRDNSGTGVLDSRCPTPKPGTSQSCFANAGVVCDDSLYCTVSDVCDGTGTCGGSARNCSDGLSCTTDSCNETTDLCVNNYQAGYPKCTANSDCNDSNSNTKDTCGTPGVCTGSCTNTPCTADGWYDVSPAVTQWVLTADPNPDDCVYPEKQQKQQENRDYSSVNGAACTYSVTGTRWTDTGSMRNSNVASGTLCNDGNACTQTDTCNGLGACVGSNPVVCTALDECHNAGTCNTGTGVCSNPNKADGTQCGSAINYCKTSSSCDTQQHYKTCQSGSCTSPPFTADVNVAGTACSGQSCGSYVDYCLANPGKLRDYSLTTGTCSASSETCNAPSYSDYCQAGTCGAECSNGNTCSSSQCTGTNSAYYQTRSATCQSTDCQCPAWGPYSSCLTSWNSCGQNVECYTGTGCDTSVGSCACQAGYIPDPANPGSCKVPESYNWQTGAWSSCSVQCGTGTQTRTVVCKDSSGNTVPDSNCTPPKPSPSQSCNAGSCSSTNCPVDGCYGTLKWYDYPPTVPNACVSGTCESNSCTATRTCNIASCGAECETNNCSTSKCDNNANGYRYQQTRAATCQSSCLCPAWSSYQSCLDSWNNCPTSGSYLRVECYQGTGCNTATNACTCNAGYAQDGLGGCSLIATPDFSLGLPASSTVTKGTNSVNTISVTPINGFSSNIGSWLVQNCPAGAGCTVSPASCASPYSNCDLTVTTGSVAPGTYTGIRAQGTGNGLTRTSGSMTLTVNAAPDTTLPTCGAPSYSPSGWTFGSVTVTVSCTDNAGGSGCVQPTYSTTRSANGPGTITIADNAGNTASCPYNVTNIDTLAPVLSSPTYLTVEGTQCSGASCPGAAPTITSGDPDISWTTSDSGGSGLKQTETWRASGNCSSPTGWIKIDTDTVSAANGSHTDAGVANGTYCYGLHVVDNANNCRNEDGTVCGGPDAATTARGPITVTVSRTTPDFSVSLTPSSQTVTQGSNATYSISITPSAGFASSVGSWTVQNCPAGAGCTVSPASCASASYASCGTLTITTASVSAGTYSNIAVTGIGGGLTRTSSPPVSVTVNTPGQCTPPGDPVDPPSWVCTGSAIDITWDWDPVAGANDYRLQADDNSDFSSPVFDQWIGNITQYTTANLPPGAYYGHVRARGSCGLDSNWSPTETVTGTCGGGIPAANFTYCRPDPAGQPNTVRFTDTSTDDGSIVSRDWDFGDGSANSSLQNPTHNFQTGATSALPGKPIAESLPRWRRLVRATAAAMREIAAAFNSPQAFAQAGTNIVAKANGGQYIAGSSCYHEGLPDAECWDDNAIDGDILGWDGTVTADNLPGANAIFAFAGLQTKPIDKIRILTDTGVGFSSRWVQNFRFQVSTTGTAAGDFTTVYTGTKTKTANFQDFTFAPTQAKYAKLIIDAVNPNYGDANYIQLGELQVYEAAAAGPPYSVTLTVTDNDSLADLETKSIDPASTNTCDTQAPVITAFAPSSSSMCSGGSVTLSWASTDNIAVSKVEIWQNPGSGWVQVPTGTCSGNQPASGSCTVAPSATTQYGAHAVDAAGNCIDEKGLHCGGVASDSLDPRTAVGPDTVTVNAVPGTPGNPSYSGTTQTSTSVSWTAASGVFSYDLYHCAGATCTRPAIATHAGVSSPYADNTDLACNTPYRYWVGANNSCGTTYSSSGTTVTTSACPANQAPSKPILIPPN